MIRDRNIAKDANIQLHKILGSSVGGQLLTGELFWVGNSGDAAYNAMSTKVEADHLFTTIDAAVGACTANRGDVIAVMEGHNESVTAAAGLALDVAGITIVFLGTGTSQAKITFGTDADADMDVDAADITLVRPKFVAAIDSLTGPIDVNASDFKMINAEYYDATDVETLDAVVTDANATRLQIDGYKYFSVTETADLKQSHIQLNGCDDISLKNIDIRGNFFVGCIENVTDEVLNARFENVYLENLNATPKPALYLDANATGSCKNVKLKIYSGSTYSNSVGKMSWDDRCEGFMGDGYAGEPLGTVLGTGIEGKIDTIQAELSGAAGIASFPTGAAPANNISIAEVIRFIYDGLFGTTGLASFPSAAAAANDVSLVEVIRYMSELQLPRIALKSTGDLTSFGTSKNLFTVTGDVLCKVGASIDVAVTSTSGTTTLEVGIAGNTACLCLQDAVDNTAFAVGDSWTKTTAADANGAEMADEWVLIGNGSTIILTGSVDDITAGDIDFYCQYIPLTSGSSIVAA